MKNTKEKLLNDLYIALDNAIKHKKNKTSVKQFVKDKDEKLQQLCEELWNKTYVPQQSSVFIIEDPKKREIFAAEFRDRIVHHLYFNYTHQLFENTFIHDSYSCIKGKGTHFGIRRLQKHIRQESNNYQKKCYALKMDIKGYFMHINRRKLCDIAIKSLEKMRKHKIDNKSNKIWDEVLDFEFLYYLTEQIALLDPSVNCIFKSKKEAWNGLSDTKSLFKVEDGNGLPIGNLTSQLFSNVFLNLLDQYVKQELKCKHYGRYVDDFYIVSRDKNFIHSIIPKIEKFLKEELKLDINKGKTRIINVKYGVEFLGAFIKENRIYVSNECLKRIKKKIYSKRFKYRKNIENSVNSYLGVLKHYKTYNIRKHIFDDLPFLKEKGLFNCDYTKYRLFENVDLDKLLAHI